MKPLADIVREIIKALIIPFLIIIVLEALLFFAFGITYTTKEIILAFLPSFFAFIYEGIRKTPSYINIIAKLRNYLSNEPILWEIRGVYIDENINPFAIKNDIKQVEDIIKSSYSNIKNDVRTPNKYVYYADCVRLEFTITNDIDYSIAEKTGKYMLDISISSESPIKTFMRKHEDKLINPIYDYFSNKYEPTKFEVTTNIKPIPIKLLEELENISIKKYRLDLNTSEKNIFIRFSDKNGIECTGRTLKDCLFYINKYVS